MALAKIGPERGEKGGTFAAGAILPTLRSRLRLQPAAARGKVAKKKKKE